MARSFSASDYAGFDSKNLSVYYGYEETTEDGEWCFVARVKAKEVLRVPASQLQAGDRFDCADNLLAGLAILFDKYSIS